MKEKDKSERIKVGDIVYIQATGKKGTYHADFSYGGIHKRKSLRTANRKIATTRARELETQITEGSFESKPKIERKYNMKLEQAINDYIEFCTTEKRRRKTISRYHGILNFFAAFATRKKVIKVADVTMVLVDKYRAERTITLSPKSMHNEGSQLKRFLAWCEEREVIERNPLGKRKFAPPRPKKHGVLSLHQMNEILENATDIRRPLFATLMFTGMRSGELRNLRVEDVDFKGNWIHIRSRPGFETKNGDDRKVPIHPRLKEILLKLPKSKGNWFFNALPSNKYPEGDHHINPKTLNEDLLVVLKRLNLPAGRETNGFTVHSFRNFFRTVSVNANTPERVVDLWLGHNDHGTMGSLYYTLDDTESQKFMHAIFLPSTTKSNPVSSL